MPRWIGPFKIVKKLSDNVVELRLPEHMKMHHRFNVDKLKHYPKNSEQFQGRQIPKATPIIINDEGEKLYIIETLLKKRILSGKLEHLLKWHGWPIEESTWELEKNIKHVSHWKRLVSELNLKSPLTKS